MNLTAIIIALLAATALAMYRIDHERNRLVRAALIVAAAVCISVAYGALAAAGAGI